MGRILFIRGGAVGDFILTMPSIQLVRDTLPDNEIEILAYPAIASLATATGLATRVRSIEDSRLATFFIPKAKLDPEWVAYFSSFDVVISCLYDPDGYFEGNLRAAGVDTIVSCPYRPDESAPHVPAAVQFAQPLASLGFFLDEPSLRLRFPEPEDSLFPPGNGPLIALHPGSGGAHKNWSHESWASVLHTLSQKFADLRLIITTGEAEYQTKEQFLALLDDLSVSYHHLDSRPLPELGALYQRVTAFLGHDSGLSHLAAATGAPGLLLFGPTEPGIWAPVSPKVRVLRSPDRSMGSISVEKVIEEVQHLFTDS